MSDSGPRSKVYTEPTSGKDGLKRTMKSSHERNKQGLPRSRRNKTKKFDANIEKRGNATNKKKEAEEDDKPAISPYWVAVFAFLVIGSAVFQIITQSQGSLLG